MPQEYAIPEPAAEIQEEPWQHGKKIGGAEFRPGKSQRCQDLDIVESFRQADLQKGTKTDRSGLYIPEKQEQDEADQDPCIRRDFFRRRIQRDHQQDGAADKIQYAEPDRLRRHEEKRDGRDKEAAQVDDHAPAQILLFSPGPDKAGDQDERPADRLLPDMRARAEVPAGIPAEHDENIIRKVEQDHADDRDAAEGIDQVIAPGVCRPVYSGFI